MPRKGLDGSAWLRAIDACVRMFVRVCESRRKFCCCCHCTRWLVPSSSSLFTRHSTVAIFHFFTRLRERRISGHGYSLSNCNPTSANLDPRLPPRPPPAIPLPTAIRPPPTHAVNTAIIRPPSAAYPWSARISLISLNFDPYVLRSLEIAHFLLSTFVSL